MLLELEFQPINLDDPWVRGGLSVIVATVKDGAIDQYQVAGYVGDVWCYHGRPLLFKPTHYANPRV